MKKVKKSKIYMSADCHGIESFTKDRDSVSMMVMRAMANEQRHYIVAEVEMRAELVDYINYILKDKQDYVSALKIIKGSCKGIRIPKDFGGLWIDDTEIKLHPSGMKNYDLIPNPNLDPYR
jgi:hypothetical protein